MTLLVFQRCQERYEPFIRQVLLQEREWANYLILADRCEEDGEEDLARGLRWLVEQQTHVRKPQVWNFSAGHWTTDPQWGFAVGRLPPTVSMRMERYRNPQNGSTTWLEEVEALGRCVDPEWQE